MKSVNKIKRAIIALFALTVTCFAAAYGCGGENAAVPVSFENETRTVEYAAVFTVSETVRDDKGGYYIAAGTVKDSAGADVELYAGKLLVTDLNGYTVTQTVTVGGKEYSRVITLKVTYEYVPMVELGEFEKYLYLGRKYELPSATAYDFIDGELTGLTYKVYSVSGEEEAEQPVGTGYYMPSASGKQYLKVGATNSAGKTGYGIKEFTVRAAREDGEYESFSEPASMETLTTHTAMVTGKEFLEEFEGRQGVAAVTVKADSIERTVLRLRPYSLNKSDYESYRYLAITMYITGTINNVRLYKGLSTESDTTFKFTGDNAIRYNEWHTYLFPADKVFENWDTIISEEKVGNQAIMTLCGGELRDDPEDPTRVTGGGGTVYIDGVYFANVTDVKADAKLSGNNVTVTLTALDAENAEFDFTVTYGGVRIEKNGNTFVAREQGMYYVTPVSKRNDVVYVGGAIPVPVSFDLDAIRDNIGYDKVWN